MGRARYIPEQDGIVWKIRKFPGDTEYTLRAEVELIATVSVEKKAWSRPPITMEFQVQRKGKERKRKEKRKRKKRKEKLKQANEQCEVKNPLQPGDTEYTLRAEVELIATVSVEKKAWSRPPITMEFQVQRKGNRKRKKKKEKKKAKTNK